MGTWSLLLVVLALLALVVAATRARQLCVLSVRAGKLLVMRGGLPGSLLEALADGERARLDARGLSPETLQRARNVLGTYPLVRLLNAPRPRDRNLGQVLGLPSLAFWLRARARGR
jgi:hypothetical protein